MMASDVIVVDYSAMLSLAVLSGKKIILSEFPEGKIWKKSLAHEVKNVFPTITKAQELEDALHELENDAYDQVLKKFQDELYVSKEDYQKEIQMITKELLFGSENLAISN
jgi:predicted nucleic acid-binding protein